MSLALQQAGAAELYVAAGGTPAGSGTLSRPYDLKTALSGSVGRAGDTFWLRGGTYSLGHVDTRIHGEPGRPFTFRPIPGEKARVDGSFTIWDSIGHVIFRDFELFNSNPRRVSSQTGVGFKPTDIEIIAGIQSYAPNCSFINLVIHDHTRHGIYVSQLSSGNLIYGCLIYNNGWRSPDNAEGHSLYIQGSSGQREVSDNVLFNSAGAGMHVYENGGQPVVGVTMDGNVAFNASVIQNVRAYRDWIIGADAPSRYADRIVFKNNMGYLRSGSRTTTQVEMGREGVNGTVTMIDNYMPLGLRMNNWTTATVTRNTFAPRTSDYVVDLQEGSNVLAATWNENNYWRLSTGRGFRSDSTTYTFPEWRSVTGYDLASTDAVGQLTGSKVFVRPNRYETGRANIIVYNWSDLSSVPVDVSSILPPGTAYEVRNAQDFFAAPVLSGTFNGQPLLLPMGGLTVAAPLGGMLTPPPTGPIFNVFVLLPLSSPTNSNTAPMISSIGNQTTAFNTATAPIPFAVSDAETAAGSLTVSGSSSNPTLVPNGSIVFGGSGSNRTVTVTPAANQTGVATITLTVSDGSLSTTTSFVLTVNAALVAPTITTQPASRTVTNGGVATFSVVAAGSAPLSYRWLFGGVSLAGASNATLTLTAVTTNDAGVYTVVVTNSVGSVTSNPAILTINPSAVAPTIAAQPVSLIVMAGGNATFAVIANGTPPLHYQWRKNAANLSGATNTTFVIANTQQASAGDYTVVVSNSAGSITSAVATLTVNAPPALDMKRPTLKVLFPKVAFTRVLSNSVTLSGTAQDDQNVASVEVQQGTNDFTAATGTTNWTADLALGPGTNVFRVRATDAAGNHSLTNTRTVFFAVMTPLSLATNGNGAVKGATNGQMFELGRNFTLTAIPAPGFVFSNWAITTSTVLAHRSVPTLTYLMASNLAVSAQFVPNPFAAAGTFNGLFYETNGARGVLHGTSGFFALSLTTRGTYTARLLSGGFKLTASGQFSLDGTATNAILRKGTNALSVVWSLGLAGHDTLTGTVRDADGNWLAELNGDRAIFNAKTNPCALAGKYTLLLPGLPGDAFVPGGHSYGTVGIDRNGVLTLKGYLADKTTAAQKVPVSKNVHWPLYVPLYSGKGSLLSWVAFTNRAGDDFHGLFHWSKSALPTAKYYPLGFITNQNTLVGARYAAPAGATNKLLNLTNATLTLTGGNPPADYTNALLLGLRSKVTNGGPHKLSLSFTLSSGLFKGSLTPANVGARAVSFAGAVMQKSTTAAGHFLGTNQSGRVTIEPAP